MKKRFEIRELTKAVGSSDMNDDVIQAVNDILQAVEEFYVRVGNKRFEWED